MQILPYFLLCMLTSSQLGCGVFEAEGPLPFSWIQEGSQMTYGFVAGPEPYTDVYNDYTYDSAERVTRIVIREPEWVNFEFTRVSPFNSGWKGAPGIGGSVVMHLEALDGTPEPERTEDGIRIPYPAECDRGFLGEVEYTLRLPAEPEEGKHYFIRGSAERCGSATRPWWWTRRSRCRQRPSRTSSCSTTGSSTRRRTGEGRANPGREVQ